MVAEALRGDEVLDRRLLVGEQVRERERAAAHRLEVLRRTDAAAHDHEVRRRALAHEDLGRGDELLPALLPADEAGEADRDAVLRQAERRLAADAGRRRRPHGVVHDLEPQPDREPRRDVAVDRDRGVAERLHERARSCASDGRGLRRRAPSAGARRPSRRGLCATQAAARSGESFRCTIGKRCSRMSCESCWTCGCSDEISRLSTSQRRPSYGESHACAKIETLPGVHDRAGVREQVGCRSLRAEHVRLEARIEMADELRERRRRAAELRAVVHVQDRDAVLRREDLVVDRLDSTRVPGRVEVLLGVRARGAPERVAPVGVLQELRDRVRDRVDAVVGDEDAGLARDDDAAAGARAGRDDGHAARRGLDHRAPELGALRRRDDDVGCLVEVRRVLRERDEAHDVVELRARGRAASPPTRSRASGRRAGASGRRRCGRTPGRGRRRRRRGSSRRRRARAAAPRPR